MTAKKKIWIVFGIIFGVIIILSIINSFIPTEAEKRFQANLEAEKAKMAEQKKEKQKIFDYNLEHKEEHYQKGLELLKEKNYQEALEMFDKIILVDKDYKDIQEKARITYNTLAEIEEKKEKERIRIRKKKELVAAKQMIIDAKKLSKSNNCGDISQAVTKSKSALRTLADSKEAKSILLQAQIQYLRCGKGNSELEMSIQISGYKPLQLHVWITNKSNEVRHANPNHFTLVTVKNRSLSISSETYGLGSYFDAVDLQPGTQTSGSIIFDTYDKPKKLIYSETFGTTIEREFPFK